MCNQKMPFQPKIQPIFYDVMQFLGVKFENDVIWRHVRSAGMISLNDILFVSKYEVIRII